ncbi:MAG: PilZ domain-containing protein [bacterium]
MTEDRRGPRGDDHFAVGQAAQDAIEKRRYERLKAGLQIKYRPVGPTEEATLVKGGDFAAPAALEAGTPETRDFHKVLCEDISLGGLKIVTSFPVAETTRLWVQISIPGVPLPVNAVAEVRWSRRAGSLCSSGLQFHTISKNDLAKVERFLTLQKAMGNGKGV